MMIHVIFYMWFAYVIILSFYVSVIKVKSNKQLTYSNLGWFIQGIVFMSGPFIISLIR